MLYNHIKMEKIPEVVFGHIYSCRNYGSIFKPMVANIEIAYIKTGELRLQICGKEFLVPEKSFLVLPHKYAFVLKSAENKEHIHYTVSAMVDENSGLSEECIKNSQSDMLCIPICVEYCSRTEYLAELLCEAIKEYQKTDIMSKYKCGALFIEMLCELSRVADNNLKELQVSSKIEVLDGRIKKFIAKNINQKITLSDIADGIGKNANYLNQVFKRRNDMSIISYVNLMKMKRVAVLITDEHMTLKEAAKEVGISDVNYLSRLFKNKMGMTVSEFKANSVDNTFLLYDMDKIFKKNIT